MKRKKLYMAYLIICRNINFLQGRGKATFVLTFIYLIVWLNIRILSVSEIRTGKIFMLIPLSAALLTVPWSIIRIC